MPPRHSGFVRVTHWITVVSFFGLLVGGIAILLAHPRLYWGETGAFGDNSLFDLPLPVVLSQSSWGRNLHFLSAWICVITGLLYVAHGVITKHIWSSLLPDKSDLSFGGVGRLIYDHLRMKRPAENESFRYNLLQRGAYLTVIFILFPLVIATGLAMSPSITSVLPGLVTVFGGHQSARTVHFFVALLIVLFLIIHIGMVCLAGFAARVAAMITGYRSTNGNHR